MTGMELKIQIVRLGLTQNDFGSVIGKSNDTITRYVRGEKPVPKLVALVVESLTPERAKALLSEELPA